MKDDNEPPEMIETALKQNVNFLIVEDDETPVHCHDVRIGKVTVALEEQKEFNKQLSERLDQQEEFNRSLLEKLEQQQRYIDERMEQRDGQILFES